MLRVPVLSKAGKPLMPTKASRARRGRRIDRIKLLPVSAIHLRKWLGLEKDEKNKSNQAPDTHAVDGVTLAALEFVHWKEWHSATAKHGNWMGAVEITPSPLIFS